MNSHPETSVIILNWNGARLLPACLSALAAQSYRDFDLWLVDNGSIDESLNLLDDLERLPAPEWLNSPSPLPSTPHIIRNTSNRGFSAGNNQALRLTPAPLVALLNNDAIPHTDWLANLVQTMRDGPPDLGMVASTMLFAHRPSIVASAGISIHTDGVALDRAVGIPSDRLLHLGTRPVFGPSAGAALYKSAMLQDVGLFDPRFFSYLEDADLAWRARALGWKALHQPLATVTHEYSATGGHNSPFKRFLLSRNRIWLLYKNMPSPLLARYWPHIARYDALAFLHATLTADTHLIRGRLQALHALPRFAPGRRAIASSARLHPSQLAPLLSPALSPRATLAFRSRLSSLLSN